VDIFVRGISLAPVPVVSTDRVNNS
jgi:hypothetical protein